MKWSYNSISTGGGVHFALPQKQIFVHLDFSKAISNTNLTRILIAFIWYDICTIWSYTANVHTSITKNLKDLYDPLKSKCLFWDFPIECDKQRKMFADWTSTKNTQQRDEKNWKYEKQPKS